jgi:hypothetical protein
MSENRIGMDRRHFIKLAALAAVGFQANMQTGILPLGRTKGGREVDEMTTGKRPCSQKSHNHIPGHLATGNISTPFPPRLP